VLVADSQNSRIQISHSTGKVLSAWGATGRQAGSSCFRSR
jgi:hypothetical protein